MNQKQITFDAKKLTTLAQKLSLHFWGKSCDIPVQWNGRLTKAMGRFVFAIQGRSRTPLRIELSKHAVHFINEEIFIAVLLHELCHYHQFRASKPYEDGHPEFEQELQRVGAISTNTVQLPQRAYLLSCQKCHKRLGTRKRLNTARYLSGCCQAPIEKKETWLGKFQYDGRILKHSKVNFIREESDRLL